MTSPAVGLILPLLAVNVVTFLVFAHDKACARRGAWRVPERQLFLLMLLGGSFGGWLAMVSLHHKHRKTSFRSVAAIIVLFQLAVLAGVLYEWMQSTWLP
jgi:uncharacterized membrane protein YsdA (DUF1294 family)